MTWEVRIVEKGRFGYIDYIENGEICRCEWEFDGGDTLAILVVLAAEEWDTHYTTLACTRRRRRCRKTV